MKKLLLERLITKITETIIIFNIHIKEKIFAWDIYLTPNEVAACSKKH